jgi:TPR repeat protein
MQTVRTTKPIRFVILSVLASAAFHFATSSAEDGNDRVYVEFFEAHESVFDNAADATKLCQQLDAPITAALTSTPLLWDTYQRNDGKYGLRRTCFAGFKPRAEVEALGKLERETRGVQTILAFYGAKVCQRCAGNGFLTKVVGKKLHPVYHTLEDDVASEKCPDCAGVGWLFIGKRNDQAGKPQADGAAKGSLPTEVKVVQMSDKSEFVARDLTIKDGKATCVLLDGTEKVVDSKEIRLVRKKTIEAPASAAGATNAADSKAKADAIYAEAVKFYKGEGCAKDDAKAARLFKQAGEMGDVDGVFDYGLCLEDGIGVAKDENEAFALISRAGTQGLARAQSKLGECYYVGKMGQEVDYAESAKWFGKAAEQGDAWAEFCLGVMYIEGKGVRKNTVEGTKWLRKAAAQGQPDAVKWVKETDGR